MISAGLLLGSDPKSKICTTSSHTRCSCSALGYLDVLEQLGRSCIVVSRLVLFLSEDEERLGSWCTPTVLFRFMEGGEFSLWWRIPKGLQLCENADNHLEIGFVFEGRNQILWISWNPKESFLKKGEKRVTIICILWYTLTSVGRLSTFEHISLLLVLGAFYDFHISLVLGPRLILDWYEAGIYQCQAV